jgi:hypothetical protein
MRSVEMPFRQSVAHEHAEQGACAMQTNAMRLLSSGLVIPSAGQRGASRKIASEGR